MRSPVWITLQIREVDHRIAVGVSAPEVISADLDAAQEDRGLIGEGHARSARLLVAQEIFAHVAVRDDLGRVDERRVATGVIGMMVRVEEILHRLCVMLFTFSRISATFS